MNRVLQFEFDPLIEIADAEATLHVAIVAVEGLLGEARIRTDLTYHADPVHRFIQIDGSGEVGDAVIRALVSLLTREFGAGSFAVRRVAADEAQTNEVAG